MRWITVPVFTGDRLFAGAKGMDSILRGNNGGAGMTGGVERDCGVGDGWSVPEPPLRVVNNVGFNSMGSVCFHGDNGGRAEACRAIY